MAGTVVKRSLSTPNVQAAAAAMAEGGLAYSTDKRRNKLGYHRTSVACGHCRRRKIRCLLAKDDPHGRCSNCIRLKKECNFYPVESSDRRPRSMSKPDINGDMGSSGSSPSPGLGMGPNPYPSSVPVTPTYDFSSKPYDDFRHNSFASTGRLSMSHSNSVSRKPSLAQMHVMPLAMKAELLGPHEFPRPGWDLASQSYPDQHRRHIPEQIQTGLADPSSAFWRLSSSSSSPMTAAPIVPSQPHAGNFDYEAESPEDHGWQRNPPSRVGSVDQGLHHIYGYGATYSSEGEFTGPPEMCSANASTVSLTASISDASQYGGDSRPNSQFYSSPWTEQATLGNGYEMSTPIKQEAYDAHHPMYLEESCYGQSVDENQFMFQSPMKSPEDVPMHV